MKVETTQTTGPRARPSRSRRWPMFGVAALIVVTIAAVALWVGGQRGRAHGRGGVGISLKTRAPSRIDLGFEVKKLMAAVVNHPHIYSQVEEEFRRLQSSDSRYSAFKYCVSEKIEDAVSIDSKALQSHLRSEGFEQEMRDILNESVYRHADFASPSYEPQDDEDSTVEQKWLQHWSSIQRMSLKEETERGWKDAVEHSNENDEERLRLMMQIESEEAS